MTAKAKPQRLPRVVLPTLPPHIFDGKPPQTERQALRWVLDNLILENVKPEDCPSAKAWFFYSRAIQDPEFANTLALKFVPSRADLLKQQGHHDDGRNVRNRLERIRARAGEYAAARHKAGLVATS